MESDRKMALLRTELTGVCPKTADASLLAFFPLGWGPEKGIYAYDKVVGYVIGSDSQP